tara:strand:- start:885 stop:1079 length:195 start_codon:yes stop_codon:yes gene_type:complete
MEAQEVGHQKSQLKEQRNQNQKLPKDMLIKKLVLMGFCLFGFSSSSSPVWADGNSSEPFTKCLD